MLYIVLHRVNYEKKKATLKATWRLDFIIVICPVISHLNLMFPISNFFHNLSSPFHSQSRISHCMLFSFSCPPSEYCLILSWHLKLVFPTVYITILIFLSPNLFFALYIILFPIRILYILLTIYNNFTIWILFNLLLHLKDSINQMIIIIKHGALIQMQKI